DLYKTQPKYITIRGKGELLAKLRKEVKAVDKIYLATDPDREGEAISWHLLYALKLEGKKVFRITFNEITKTAVQKSIKEAREIDMDLVDAQQARRTLDRIVGYKMSPLLWKKIKKGLSAGRVQSVALRLICDRDEEIENFIPEEYWTIDTEFKTNKNEKINSKFYGKNGKKLEVKSKKEVDKILDEIKGKTFIIKEVKEGKRHKNPSAPFTTSTLQQEASKIFGYASSKTMMIAQQLYEGINIKGEGTVGLVSYIRTDSVRISDEAYNQVKDYVLNEFGEEYFSKERKEYKSKGKTQDAHEAIRPTYTERTPDSIKESLTKEQYKLYKLIWERFVASQMAPAIYKTMTVKIECNQYEFRASGSILTFEGYLKVYKKNEEKEEEILMPEVQEKEELTIKKIKEEQHFTQPPARYSEASLIKTLEEIGVGRPSTYAPTISTITARNYVTKESKVFYTTELGEVVNDIIKNNFGDIINVDFTAKMEASLDEIEEGKLEWKQILREFYPEFEKMILEAEEKVEHIDIEDEKTDIICEECGANMVIKYGKYGKFLACPNFPECKNTKPFFEETGINCPECSGKILIKKTKKGRKFYGCENNPECEFMSWNKPTGEKCPKCSSYMIEKGTKNTRICCSNQKCGYIANS
ncbi:MAG: type I DNA topoisomerase, partial [Eubacteriales bacterium]|nr:type I DNA topoisomerase [Eubacteriales bacterium]